MRAQAIVLGSLILSSAGGCYSPAAVATPRTDGGAVASGVDAGSGFDLTADGGPIALQCASDPMDGGDVYRIEVLEPPTPSDGGDYVLDAGFRLLVGVGPLHPAPGATTTMTLITATGNASGTGGWVDGISVVFDGGSLWADLTYIHQYLMGSAQVAGGPTGDLLCWSRGEWTGNSSPAYTYVADAGVCQTTAGTDVFTGTNFTELVYLRETGDGQCARLFQELSEGDPSHPTLRGWDLRGADLTNASLHGADLVDAQLQGANLSALTFGQASIRGTIDSFTQLPTSCQVVGDQATCIR